jgi:hypothetical protein
MRKLTIMLFFLGIAMTSKPVFSAEILNFGAIWKTWDVGSQNVYLWGFVDGGSNAMIAVMGEIIYSNNKGLTVPKNLYENIRKKTTINFDENKLRDMMTTIYKDPKNSFIPFQDMVYIARDSLNGDDISASLLKARKAAMPKLSR